MNTHLIKKCEEDHICMVEVVLFHITIAFVRSGWLLVTLLFYKNRFSHSIFVDFLLSTLVGYSLYLPKNFPSTSFSASH